MSTVLLRNINPLGAVDLPLIGREEGPDLEHYGTPGVGCLEPGEVFEVDADVAGHAPHWRPVTEADSAEWLRCLEVREVPAATEDEPAVLEVFDPGSGLLAQVGNYELVTSKRPKKDQAAGASAASDTTTAQEG
jgi:hypothetical protein